MKYEAAKRFLWKSFLKSICFATWSSWIMYFFSHLISYYCGRNCYENLCYSSYFPPFTLNHIPYKRSRFSFLFSSRFNNTVDWLVFHCGKGWSFMLMLSQIHDHQFLGGNAFETSTGKREKIYWWREKKEL